MPTGESDVVVVGGGIAGLSAALRLRQAGLRARVLEARSRVGGLLSTTLADGMILEGAANAFLGNAEDGAVDLAAELGVAMTEASSAARRRWIFMDGRLCALPTSPLEFLSSEILSARGKARLFGEPLHAPADGEESVYDFARRRLGEEVARNLVAPFVVGVFAGDARALSVEAAFPKLAELDRQGGLVVGTLRRMLAGRKGDKRRRPRMWSPENGVQSLVDALARELEEDIELGARVLELRRQGGGLSIVVDGREPVRARAVVLASPAHVAADLVAELAPNSAAVLRRIPTVSVVVNHLVFHREQVHHPLDGFGFLVRDGEPIDILGCVFESTLWPNRSSRDRILLRCMLGGARAPDAVEWSDEDIVDASIRALDDALGVSGAPLDSHIVRWRDAIPQYPPGHRSAVAAIENELEGDGIVLAGNAYHGVSVNDCVAGGRRIAARVAKLLAVAAVSALAGCSGPSVAPATAKDAGDAGSHPHQGGVDQVDEAGSELGRAVISVEWKEPPFLALRSPGTDACGRERRPALAVHSAGGVRGAIVVLDQPAASATMAAVAIRDCRVEPRIAAASGQPWTLAVINRDERSHRALVRGSDGEAAMSLRVLGQRRLVSGDQDGLFRIDVDGDVGVGYFYAAGDRRVAVTDDTGVAVFDDLAVGSHEATIIHPPLAAEGKAIIASARVEVAADGTARRSVSLVP